MVLTTVILKFQDYCAYPLKFDDTPNYIDMRNVGWVQGPVLHVEAKVGADTVIVPLIPDCVLC